MSSALGTFSGDSRYRIQTNGSDTQDETNNRSLISWNVKILKSSGTGKWGADYGNNGSLTSSAGTRWSVANRLAYNLRNVSSQTIASGSFYVSHDSDGYASYYLTGNLDLGGLGSTSAGTGWISLPRIAKRPSTPGTPTFSENGPSSVRVSWSESTDDNGDAIDTYILRRWNNSSGTGSYVDSSANNLSRVVSGLAVGDYTFAVMSKNGSADNGGYSNFSAKAVVRITKRPNPPGTPTFSEALPTSIRVSWPASSYDGGDAIDGYLLRRWDNAQGTGSYTDNWANNLSRVVSGLTPGQQYTFAVFARNGATDNSGYSNMSNSAFVRMLAGVQIKVSGVWRLAIPYVKVSGVWKLASPYVKVSGTWKLSS